MGFISFYGTALGRAFVESVNFAQLIVFVALAALGLVAPKLRHTTSNQLHAKITGPRAALILLLALIVVRVPVAIYNMYSEEIVARQAAEVQSACLARIFAEQKDRTTEKSQLEQFYILGGHILYANLPKDISKEDFDKYVASFNAWAKETFEWISENLGEAAAARFNDYGAGSAMNWDRAVNPQHNNIINLVTPLRANLSKLIETGSWDVTRSVEDCRRPNS